jgi:hypothetical protein
MRRVEGTEEVIIHGSQNVQIGGGAGSGVAVDPPELGGRVAVVITPTSIKIEAPAAIKLEVPGAELGLVPGVATCKAGISELMLGPTALLKSEGRVRSQCGASHVTADAMAVRVHGVAAVVNGTSITTIKSGGPTTVSGASVSMDAKLSIAMVSQGEITASCGGSQQTIMGGMINLD